jgi:hypothetical protein
MTAVNAGLLFLLTVSLFRHRRLARVPLGLAAVYYFATTGNTNFFAVGRVVGWWPAQNDALSLVFGLVALVLLDQYLVGGRRGWLVGAAVSFYLSVAAKEMGFMIGPMAIGLTLHRRAAAGGRAAAHRWTAPVALFATLSAALWEFRKLVVPKEWGPVMRRWGVLEKGLVVVFGPPFGLVHAKVYWATAAGAATLAMAAFGLRRRWRVITILAAALIASCLCAQFFDADGSFMLMFIGPGILNYTMVVTYMLGAVLFWRYRRLEAGLFAFAAVLLAYLPILHYGGAHYFYWPGAFSALMNAVFIACVVRAVPEMRRFANWDFSMPPWYQRFRESTLGLPPVPTPAAAMPRAGQTAPPGETAHE